MKQIVLIALVVTGAASCGTKPGEAQVDGASAPINVNSLTTPGSAPSTVVTQATPATNPAPVVQTSTTAATGAVNPAHGQPGHRCDLAVGAPLNSAPAATNNAAVPSPSINTSAPVITQSTPAVKTAAGMNPPHGQPGHRCDIAVGQPLNSKPATSSTPTPSVSPVVNPGGSSTTFNSSPIVTTQPVVNKTKTAPGMNPPHGEPGHRCEIAVGAPLDSKPGQVITAAIADSLKKN